MTLFIRGAHGNLRSLQRISNMEGATWEGIRKGFHNLGHTLHTIARRRIKDPPKTGRFYLRPPNRIRRYRASRSGEAPANPTGNLRSAVGFQIMGISNMSFGYRNQGKIRDASYGRRLELDMNRPNLIVAVEQTQNTAHTYFEQEIARALRPS